MTFKEIEKIKRLLSTIDSIDDFRKMQELESEVTAFFGDKFNVRLKITTLNTKEFYTKEHENTDKIAVRSFLESLIAQDINAPEIINILDLIEEGECSKNDKTLQQKYISKVFYSYSDRIKFDKMTEAIATAPQEVLNFNMYQVSEVMIDGIITKLKSYASALCTPKRSIQTSAAPIQNNQEINFQPHISIETKNDTVITIEAVFNNARQQIEDAGLPDAQIQDLYDKLSQLEEISKSKESKGKRWAKAKDIMKWLVEQGIAAAGIIIPVLSEVIK
jgi:hypothetical protein